MSPETLPRSRARLLGVLLCVLTAVGCASLDQLDDLASRVQEDGYIDTSVHHGTFSDFDTLKVTTHKAGEQTDDGETIFRLVWDTYPEDVDSVVVTVNDRRTTATKAELQEAYGPRKIQPAGNVGGGSGKVSALIFIAFLIACGATATLIIRDRRRRRRE